MLLAFTSCDTSRRIKMQHAENHVQECIRCRIRKKGFEYIKRTSLGPVIQFFHLLEPFNPYLIRIIEIHVIGRCTKHMGDMLQLVHGISARKYWVKSDHFGDNCTHSPNIHRRRIMARTQQDFWCAIPTCRHIRRQCGIFFHFACQSKIRDFNKDKHILFQSACIGTRVRIVTQARGGNQ